MDVFNRKPLAERAKEVDAKLRQKMGPRYEQFAETIQLQRFFHGVASPLFMGRELWEEYWGVFRDTVERDSEVALTRLEKAAAPRDRGIFG